MNEETFEMFVRQTYLLALNSAKTVDANSPEWDLVWGILDNVKDYYERVYEDKDGEKNFD